MQLNVKRQYLLVSAAVTTVFLFLALSHHVYRSGSMPFSLSSDGDVKSLHGGCGRINEFEEMYGRSNLRLSRAYEGSQFRIRQFLHKIARGEKVTVGVVGGSVTKGHGVWLEEIWFSILGEWLRERSEGEVVSVNGANPASGTDYFSFCFPLHVPQDVDLVLVELSINDDASPSHVDDMENLLRGLLDLPNQPAVVLVNAIAFSNGGMGGGGGRVHLPVAQYFDVPVISQRLPLVNHFARHPELVEHYFARNYWGETDTRHLNSRGHRDLAMLVASFFQDVWCEMSEPEMEAEQMRPWQHEEATLPAMWNTPAELGVLPRLRTLDGWNADLGAVVPPFRPICHSTRSPVPEFNLTPIAVDGWEHWIHPEFPDKPYWLANSTGATISFEIETHIGVIKMYSLRSRSFGLGTALCWVDSDLMRTVKAVGYWDKDPNIGEFTELAHDVAPGLHKVTCQVIDETSDPEGRHEFRIISLMSL